MSKLHYIIVLLVVLIIATLTYHLSTSVKQSSLSGIPKARHDPDYFIKDFSATVYNEAGQIDYRLDAAYMEHFPDDDTVHITKLVLNYFDPDKQNWQASSDQGIGYENIEVIHLTGNVNIRQLDNRQQQGLDLQTERLRINFKSRMANTDAEVKIVGKNSTIVATGMELDLAKGTLLLKSQAKGRYVPN